MGRPFSWFFKVIKKSPSFHMYPFLGHTIIMALFASILGPFGGFFASGFKRAFKIKVIFFQFFSVFQSSLFFHISRIFMWSSLKFKKKYEMIKICVYMYKSLFHLLWVVKIILNFGSFTWEIEILRSILAVSSIVLFWMEIWIGISYFIREVR